MKVKLANHMGRREFIVQAGRAGVGLALGSFASSGCARKSAGLRHKLIGHLERQVPEWMRESNVPGLSLVLIQDAKITWRGAFGVKNSSSKEPVDPDTIFQAASMSKPVFAYTVMKLCERGVLKLDAPLTRYTSERFVEGDPRLDLITARHVLSHTSGLPNFRSEKTPLKIYFAPGERYQYSGEGYYYLQSIVTRLLGRTDPADCAEFELGIKVCATDFDDYMRVNLLAPFGMTSSTYLLNNQLLRRMASPHDSKGKSTPMRKPTRPAVARYGSAGALLSTPTDYAKFVMAVIAPRSADTFRLNRQSIAEMLRPHVKLEGGQYPASWALGWQIFHTGARDFIYHGGDNPGFHCCAVASVAGQSGFVVMTNADNGPLIFKNLLNSEAMQQFLAA